MEKEVIWTLVFFIQCNFPLTAEKDCDLSKHLLSAMKLLLTKMGEKTKNNANVTLYFNNA